MLDQVLSVLFAVAMSAGAQGPATTRDPIPTTDVYAGMPPERFQAPRRLDLVSFGTVGQCGDPGKNAAGTQLIFLACVRGAVVHMPDPCLYPDEEFARLMCHEMAHRNGWPRAHGE